MERLAILAPALVPAAYMIVMFAVYVVRTAAGRPPAVGGAESKRASALFGRFLTTYFLWLLQPILQVGVRLRLSPNTFTLASLAFCLGAAVAIATHHLATGAWLYVFAGALDILDGRLARATGKPTRAGAFLDSVGDRWGELLVLSGFVWYLRDSAWLGAAVLAIAGSMMVSYTRARGEGVGLTLDGGTMQRAERVAIVAMGALVTAWFEAGPATAEYGLHVIGAALLITGVGATMTALGRWYSGYRRLVEMDAAAGGEPDEVRGKHDGSARASRASEDKQLGAW